MLKIENLEVSYGAVQALRGISMEVNDGEIVSLIGANGAGKTTTLHAITGLVSIKSGSVIYDGHDLRKTDPSRIVTMGLAHVPEGRQVFTRMTVAENLAMGAYFRKEKKAIADDLERVYARFPRLKERAKQLAGTLSGGEQQMLAMGRAIRRSADRPHPHHERTEAHRHGRAVHGPVARARAGGVFHHRHDA